MADIRQRLSKRQKRDIFHRQLGYKWEFCHPNLIRVTIPTLPYEAFNSAGDKVLPWHLMKLFDSGEVSTYWPINDKKDSSEQDKAVMYMVYYELQIDQAFYDTDTAKFPLLLDIEMRYVKRTSKARTATLRHPSERTIYAKEELVDVRVDPSTRKPVPFPDWWKEHFRFPSSGPTPTHTIPKKFDSTRVFSMEYRLSFSDVDENGHANFTTYPRLCFNAFAEKLYNRSLDISAENHFDNGLQKLQITFLKECLMGDRIVVEFWRDRLFENIYYFEVMKGPGVCAKLTFVFHCLKSSL